mmetsp:Transcript_93654/g.262024  ORF Transcript_93654/g.262024 Transcript_93654/m.262024 type:complete len:259 (+) Transcript_93654:649-1425(+)
MRRDERLRGQGRRQVHDLVPVQHSVASEVRHDCCLQGRVAPQPPLQGRQRLRARRELPAEDLVAQGGRSLLVHLLRQAEVPEPRDARALQLLVDPLRGGLRRRRLAAGLLPRQPCDARVEVEDDAPQGREVVPPHPRELRGVERGVLELQAHGRAPQPRRRGVAPRGGGLRSPAPHRGEVLAHRLLEDEGVDGALGGPALGAAAAGPHGGATLRRLTALLGLLNHGAREGRHLCLGPLPRQQRVVLASDAQVGVADHR